MRRGSAALAGLIAVTVVGVHAQEVPLEYQVKAAYLLNFTRFVTWPSPTDPEEPLTICVARRNPFGGLLASTLAGEQADGRPLVPRVVTGVDDACSVLFMPNGVAVDPLLREVGKAPILTVGESPDFLQRGGMIAFVLDEGRVRFAINPAAADRNGLTISSRLLQLAHPPTDVTR